MDTRIDFAAGSRALLILAIGSLGCSGEAPAALATARSELRASRSPITTAQRSGTTSRLQAISPVNEKVVWASGVLGTYALTTDGGQTWTSHVVPGAEALQFRDVQGVSARTAYLLSAGSGTDSRIYKTEDGGRTWQLQFQAPNDPDYFYDCFAFWSPKRAIVMGDGVNGRFPALRTRDGERWRDIGNSLPAAQANEGAFAASGTCVATEGDARAWIVTTNSRVLATADGGESWAAHATPIAGGTGTAGVFTVAFRDRSHGIIGGGDFAGTGIVDNVARSGDGGRTWRLTRPAPVPGAVFGLSYARGNDDEDDDGERSASARTVVVTGPGGSAWTSDEGESWNALPGATGYWAVAFASARVGWLVGTEGRILRITF